ncbi:MAG: hypothetical protein WC822_06085 [Candidatus Paceibacterota bacterium]
MAIADYLEGAVKEIEMAARVPKPKWLIVENITANQVGLPHPDGLSQPGITLLPYEKIAVKPSEWDDSPDLARFVAKGLLKTYPDNKRPDPLPKMPPDLEPEYPSDREVARQIAFKPVEDEAVALLIEVAPDKVKDPSEKHPGLDVKYLRTRHTKTLLAAKWYLDNYTLPWSQARSGMIEAQLKHIEGL